MFLFLVLSSIVWLQRKLSITFNGLCIFSWFHTELLCMMIGKDWCAIITKKFFYERKFDSRKFRIEFNHKDKLNDYKSLENRLNTQKAFKNRNCSTFIYGKWKHKLKRYLEASTKLEMEDFLCILSHWYIHQPKKMNDINS